MIWLLHWIGNIVFLDFSIQDLKPSLVLIWIECSSTLLAQLQQLTVINRNRYFYFEMRCAVSKQCLQGKVVNRFKNRFLLILTWETYIYIQNKLFRFGIRMATVLKYTWDRKSPLLTIHWMWMTCLEHAKWFFFLVKSMIHYVVAPSSLLESTLSL